MSYSVIMTMYSTGDLGSKQGISNGSNHVFSCVLNGSVKHIEDEQRTDSTVIGMSS